MKFENSVKIKELIKKTGVNGKLIHNNYSFSLGGINDIFNCNKFDVIFIESEHILNKIRTTSHMFVVTTDHIYNKAFTKFKKSMFFLTENPFDVFCDISSWITLEQNHNIPQIDLKKIPDSTSISKFSEISGDCKIGDNVNIGPFVSIERNVSVGHNTRIYPNVTIYDNVNIGDNVIIHSGCTIGSDGFYYSKSRKKFPMIGTVHIENDVEIGANTAIDKASTFETIIGARTKIDNHVHIAHDVTIGPDCLIMAHVAISGQAKIGDASIIRGMSGVTNNVNLAPKTEVLPMSGITKTTKEHTTYIGMPAVDTGSFARSRAEYRLAIYYKKELEKFRKTAKISASNNMRFIFDAIKDSSRENRISQRDKLLGNLVDSLDMLELIMLFEQHFEIELDSNNLKKYASVKDLISEINNRLITKYKQYGG